MSSGGAIALIEPELRALDSLDDELLVLCAFADERPLRGLTGLVDWRLCGALSRWFIDGFATGELGERILYPCRGRLPHRGVVLLGLGEVAHHRADRAMRIAEDAIATVKALGATSMTCELFGLDRLPSPLGRTGGRLTELIGGAGGLTRTTLVMSAATRKALDKQPLFAGRPQ